MIDGTGISAPASLQGLIYTAFLKRVRRDPEAAFCHLVDENGSSDILTCGVLLKRAETYARHYRSAGLGAGDLVILMLGHGVEPYAAFLGALMTGVRPTLMPFMNAKQDPVLFWDSHHTLFRRIDARMLITFADNGAAYEATRNGAGPPLVLDEDIRDTGSPEAFDLTPNDVAFLQHSSGTTGLKKGVMFSHARVLAHIDGYARALALRPDDCIVSWLPLYHDMGLMTAFMLPLITGLKFVALDAFHWVMKPTWLFDKIEEHAGSLVWLPNFAYQHLVNCAPDDAAYKLQSLRAVINCSEPCKSGTFRNFADRFTASGCDITKLQVSYAMAENVFAVTQTPLDQAVRCLSADRMILRAEHRYAPAAAGAEAEELLSCGPVIEGVGIRITDARRAVLADGSVGEIEIRGDYLFDRYHKLPDLTAERLAGGWYRSGDLGLIVDGALYVTGRKDDLVTIQGRNFYLHEMEHAVNQVAGVIPGRLVAVAEFNGATGSHEVSLLVEIADATDADAVMAARKAVKRRLRAEMGVVPQRVHLAPKGWLLKTTSGKIHRQANLDRYRKLRPP